MKSKHLDQILLVLGLYLIAGCLIAVFHWGDCTTQNMWIFDNLGYFLTCELIIK